MSYNMKPSIRKKPPESSRRLNSYGPESQMAQLFGERGSGVGGDRVVL